MAGSGLGRVFPAGFTWGTATAAHQIEGGNANNDWWAFEHTPGSGCTEPSGDAGPDWLIVLSVVHRLADYVSLLQARHAGEPDQPTDAAGALEAAADEVSADYATAAAAIAPGDPPPAGAGAALVVNSSFKGRGVMRAVMLVPWAIPTVVAAQMWKWMLDEKFGVIKLSL